MRREVEEMRSVGRTSGGGQSSTSPSKALGQAVDAESVVSDQLLIYRNVEELQAQNQKLLAVVRQVRIDHVCNVQIAERQIRT